RQPLTRAAPGAHVLSVSNMPQFRIHSAGENPRIPLGMGTVGGIWTGDRMGQVRIRADRPWPQRRRSSSRTVALVLAAFGVSAGVAAWIADPGDAALVSANASPSRALASFDERFLPVPSPESQARQFSTPWLDRAGSVADIRVLQAREQLARQMMMSQDWRGAVEEPSSPPSTTSVPLPRARPSDAQLEAASRAAPGGGAAQGDQRTLLQKLSDFFPARVTLASLTSGEGLFRSGPDLGSLGYDSFTAVYD